MIKKFTLFALIPFTIMAMDNENSSNLFALLSTEIQDIIASYCADDLDYKQLCLERDPEFINRLTERVFQNEPVQITEESNLYIENGNLIYNNNKIHNIYKKKYTNVRTNSNKNEHKLFNKSKPNHIPDDRAVLFALSPDKENICFTVSDFYTSQEKPLELYYDSLNNNAKGKSSQIDFLSECNSPLRTSLAHKCITDNSPSEKRKTAKKKKELENLIEQKNLFTKTGIRIPSIAISNAKQVAFEYGFNIYLYNRQTKKYKVLKQLDITNDMENAQCTSVLEFNKQETALAIKFSQEYIDKNPKENNICLLQLKHETPTLKEYFKRKLVCKNLEFNN